MPSRDGDVSLQVGGVELSGWQEIRVTRGIERMPGDFDLLVTERFPGQQAVPLTPGMPCVLKIGPDTVITGFVDRHNLGVDKASGSKVRVSGRGKCQDLVDCSAYLRGEANQLLNLTTAGVVRRLCALFEITVHAVHGEGRPVPQFNVILTETCWDIIDRVARHSDFLAFEDEQGALILSKPGEAKMASGFRQGENVEHAEVTFAHDRRYSLYEAVQTPVENLADVGRAAGAPGTFNNRARALDRTIGADAPTPGRRFRPLVIIAEGTINGENVPQKRVDWENARRAGRSQAVTLTCDSWRDSAGKLWEPNKLAPVHLPYLKLPDKEWLIAEVTYRRGRDGTRADLVLMPRDAFLPQPIILNPEDQQVAEAMRREGIARGGGGPIP